MSTFARMLRMTADAVDDFQGKARERYNEQREAGVDSQAVVDALATLAASAAAGAAEFAPRQRGCQCDNGAGKSGASAAFANISDEVEKAFGRLGLVQESELAALRKRVVDLEAKLASAGKGTPAKKKASTRPRRT